MDNEVNHIPVLLNEVIKYLNPKPGNKIIDATFGLGGHSKAILEKVGKKGKILGIEASTELCELLKVNGQMSNVILINDNFVNLKKIAEDNDFLGADAVLFDLGVSSWHFDRSDKGFSFQRDHPLDMNISSYQETQIPNSKFQIHQKTAKGIVNTYSEEELTRILKEYGEESFAKRIASKITERRKQKPIETTFELVEVIKEAVPKWYTNRRLHFATKTFQAIRIEVNDEFENLKSALKQSLELLKPGGRLVIISFHAGEDRIVKNFLREENKKNRIEILTKKPIVPTREEIKENPRSRSAKLRAAETTLTQ